MSQKAIFLFFLVVLFQEDCLPSVNFTSDSNFSFKIVWPASVLQPFFEIWNTSSEEFVRSILKASCLSNPFYQLVGRIRGENVYTGRFPFNMRLYVNDVSVSDISAVNFIVGWCKLTRSVNLKKSTMSGLLMSHRKNMSYM